MAGGFEFVECAAGLVCTCVVPVRALGAVERLAGVVWTVVAHRTDVGVLPLFGRGRRSVPTAEVAGGARLVGARHSCINE